MGGAASAPAPAAPPPGAQKDGPSSISRTSKAGAKAQKATNLDEKANALGVKLLVLSDPGQDLDDEMCFIMLRYLTERKLVNLVGVVMTLAPAFDRARLARGSLDLLGLPDVPVGVGTDGGDIAGKHTAAAFESAASSYMPSSISEAAAKLEPGRRLLHRIYCKAEPRSITCGLSCGCSSMPLDLTAMFCFVSPNRLLIIASLKDAALYLRDNESLFVSKVIPCHKIGC
jgi:hypothetical protein